MICLHSHACTWWAAPASCPCWRARYASDSESACAALPTLVRQLRLAWPSSRIRTPAISCRIDFIVTLAFGVKAMLEPGLSLTRSFRKAHPCRLRGKSLTVTRRYQAAHNIGHFRFLECSHLDESQEPKGDIVAWDQVFFPFDPQLAGSELNEVAVQSWNGPPDAIIEEQYRCDARGMIEVVISNEATGLVRRFAIRQGNSARAANG